jgi:signal transduction histidine kinase
MSRVLIVDDDSQFRRVVQLRLLSWKEDLELIIAENITQAKELLDKLSEDGLSLSLVILDQHLPDGLGIEILTHPIAKQAAILAVSSDDTPEVPANAVKAGAQHFLGKRQVSTPLFPLLVEAILEKKKLEEELIKTKITESRLETIKVLLQTLRHEINNPLGAVLGGAYLVRSGGELKEDQIKALKLIEQSGNRIKHVIEQLCHTVDLEQVIKGKEQVFHIPGDPVWGKK